MQHDQIQQHLSEVEIQWTFYLARAPWWGGIFERMKRMIKRCLKRIVGES